MLVIIVDSVDSCAVIEEECHNYTLSQAPAATRGLPNGLVQCHAAVDFMQIVYAAKQISVRSDRSLWWLMPLLIS